MKKLQLKTILFFSSFIVLYCIPDANAQNKFPASGFVGINTTNPERQLEIQAGSVPVMRLKSLKDNAEGRGYIEFQDINSRMGYIGYPNTTTNLYINNDIGNTIIPKGNVGIGIGNPSRQLEMYSAFPILRIRSSAKGNNSRGYIEYHAADGRLGYIGFPTTGNQHLYIRSDKGNVLIPAGNVGIGTTNPRNYKLAVNGNIRAKECVIETGWSDFVFEDDYKLRTLEEVERFIEQNGHLPEIPSAAEVAKNGVKLGEMDSKLLMKIEELTLYLLEQEKAIKSQRKEIEELKRKLGQE